MTNYEIFDLLCFDFEDKFDDGNIAFTQKYVGKQQIRLYHLSGREKIDVFMISWISYRKTAVSPAPQIGRHFSSVILRLEITFVCIRLSVKMKMRNVCLNKFVLSSFPSNRKKRGKKMAFQKEHDLADKYFFDNSKKNISFTHNASINELCYYISFKKISDFDVDKQIEVFRKLHKQYELAAEGWCDFQHRIILEPKFSNFDYKLIVFCTRGCKSLF